MRLKTTLMYIGSDESRGFKQGKIYEVEIFKKHTFLWVREDKFLCYKECPYSRPKTLKDNWKFMVEEDEEKLSMVWEGN